MTLHLATSYAFGRVVARVTHAPVCYVPENLLLGPCAADPDEHAQIRSDFWDLRGRDLTRFRARFRDLRTAIQSRERVVIWTTRCLADTAALWWLCAWRLLQWPLQPDLDLGMLGPDPDPRPTDFPHALALIGLRLAGAVDRTPDPRSDRFPRKPCDLQRRAASSPRAARHDEPG